MKHAPGPWFAELSNSTVFSLDGIGIAWVNYAGAKDAAQRDANARLIAAAPDLWAALKALVEDYDQLCGDGMTDDTQPEVRRQAKAAIAKAEGRS